MDDEFVFIVNYQCPRCHASLEARASGPPTWLRCPSCGRASMPPEHERIISPIIDDDTLVIGNFITHPSALPIRPRSMAPLPLSTAPKASTARLLLATGFFLATFLFLLSLLESNGILSVMSGIAAVFLLFLLSRPTTPRFRE